jgi:hypothetical protein
MAEPGRWRRRLGTTALVLLAIGVGGVAHAYEPDPVEQQGPFIRSGHKGDRVDARTFDAQLLGVRGAAIVNSRGIQHDTSGVWIIVKVRLTSHGEPVQLGQVSIRDGDGRLFRASARIDNNPPLRQLQPGIPVDCEIVFEVPKNVPLPLAARLSTSLIDIRMDGMAQLELDLTAAQVKQWAEDKTPTTLMRPILTGSEKPAQPSPSPSPSQQRSTAPTPSASTKSPSPTKSPTKKPGATKSPSPSKSPGGN